MEPVKRTQLLSMDLDEVSLVGRGDDPHAHVVISKADTQKNHDDNDDDATLRQHTEDSEDSDMSDGEIRKDDLPPEVVEYIEGLEDIAAGVLGLDDEAAYEGDEEEVGKSDDFYMVEDEDDEDLESIMKSHPEIAEAIRKADERAAYAEAVAKAERDARIHREMIEKADRLVMISDDRDSLADLLKTLYDVAPNEAEQVEKMFAAANAQIRESNLFTEVGKAAGPSDEVKAKAAEIAKSDSSLTHEQAVARVYETNPHLYTDAVKEA